MTHADQIAAFIDWAHQRGYKPNEYGFVSFGPDGDAAHKFHIECEQAGFEVHRGANHWFVTPIFPQQMAEQKSIHATWRNQDETG